MIKFVFYSIVFVSVVVLLPGNILLDVQPIDLNQPLPDTLTGALQPNERLLDTTKLFEDQLIGPESLAVFNGKIVTGSADGFLYQIDGNNMKPLLKLVEKSCATHSYNTTKCGRPLGLKFDSKGTLFVVEPSVGVFSVENIFGKNPKVNLVLDIDETGVLGKPSKFLDDLAIDEGSGLNGGHVLYISDVSVKFDLSQCNLIVFGSDMGRVIKYDINAKKVESMAEKLLFPNGVEITDDRNAILVNEFVSRQVVKIHIKGPKTGQLELLVKQLPGEPDNIRRSASVTETYWLGLYSGRTASNPNKVDYFQTRPLLSKLVCRLSHLFGNAIEFVGNIFNNCLIKEFGIDIKNCKQIAPLVFDNNPLAKAMIIEIDINGNIVDSLQSSDNSLTRISEVMEIRVNDKETVLYLGSPFNNYLGSLIKENKILQVK